MSRAELAWQRSVSAGLGMLALLIVAAPAAFAHDDNWMYVWANEPASAWYEPSTTYRHNAMGGFTWIERDGVGEYRVYFSGADLESFADDGEGRLVSAYGTAGAYCDVDQQMYPVSVHCFDATGVALDTRFNLIVTGKHDHGHPHPFVTVAAMQPSAPSYEPTELFSNADLVTRTGVGRYRVDFDDFWAGGGVAGARNAQVTVERSNTTGAGHHCNLLSWGDLVVNVQCFDASGSPADTAFYAHLQREKSDVTTVAFAWANNSTSASYAPHASYVSNPGGGPVTVTRSGPGVYSMSFAGFASVGEGFGHPQVSTYGESDRRCTVSGWSSETVGVRCFDATGAPADALYSVLFRKRYSTLFTRNFATASVDSTSSSHTLDPALTWNPRGIGTDRGPVEFTRNGVGDYVVSFNGFGVLGDDGGVALVASRRDSAPCKVQSWGGDDVRVRCFDLAGAPDDSPFEVMYLKPTADISTLGYMWKSSPSATTEVASPLYAHNPSGGQISTAKLGTGFYRVTFTGISGYGKNEGVPIVTAYGSNSDRCQLVYWSGDQVDVACFSGVGVPKDSQFSLAWFKPDESTDGMVAGLADLPFEPVYSMLESKSHYPTPDLSGVVYRSRAGLYEMNWGDLREVGFDEEYWFVSTVGTAAVYCGAYISSGRLMADCIDSGVSSTDTAFAGVALFPTRLPEPGSAAQMAAGVVSLCLLARRKSASRRRHSVR